MKFLLAVRVLFGTQSDLLIELALKFRKKKKEKKTTSQKIAKNDCFFKHFSCHCLFLFRILVLVHHSHRDSDAFTKTSSSLGAKIHLCTVKYS